MEGFGCQAAAAKEASGDFIDDGNGGKEKKKMRNKAHKANDASS